MADKNNTQPFISTNKSYSSHEHQQATVQWRMHIYFRSLTLEIFNIVFIIIIWNVAFGLFAKYRFNCLQMHQIACWLFCLLLLLFVLFDFYCLLFNLILYDSVYFIWLLILALDACSLYVYFVNYVHSVHRFSHWKNNIDTHSDKKKKSDWKWYSVKKGNWVSKNYLIVRD